MKIHSESMTPSKAAAQVIADEANEVFEKRRVAAAAMGSSTSAAKTAAVRINATKPRPNAQGKPKTRKTKTE